MKELRDMLGERGLETKGRSKQILVDRLLSSPAARAEPITQSDTAPRTEEESAAKATAPVPPTASAAPDTPAAPALIA